MQRVQVLSIRLYKLLLSYSRHVYKGAAYWQVLSIRLYKLLLSYSRHVYKGAAY